jgi:1,4-alpha-glucan branching enzyme
MAPISVQFTFHTGLNRQVFTNARLVGSWNPAGGPSQQWTESPMDGGLDEAGCPWFTATVQFDPAYQGTVFNWGVMADTTSTPNCWVIGTEVPDQNSADRYRSFTLAPGNNDQDYWFATGRRFGAQKFFLSGQAEPAISFSVWAPYAQKVEVVFAAFDGTAAASGYIADDGAGIDTSIGNQGAFPMFPRGNGVWETDLTQSPALSRFADFLNKLYMYRITNEQGNVTYKADIYSRNQIGRGSVNPGGAHYGGNYQDLDGIVSCSVVSDPDLLTADFNDTGVMKQTLIPASEFWSNEFTFGNMPPQQIEDLVIYELHVGSLGFGTTVAGTFADALNFVAQLASLGVNAVELLPVLEFDGDLQWGYGTSLFFCLQSSAGGGNQLKHFVRACHQNGIAVILDVVYNHFSTSNGERTEWGYDSDPSQAPQHNTYYWYEGQPSDYSFLEGGYLDNDSTGWAPRLWEENVRQMFTSSAAALLDDFHIDGLRVDLTDALHQDNALHSNGQSVPAANLYGIKLLRELANTVNLINPRSFLIAEDHTGWSAMTQPLSQGGIGFDAVWYADFYHHLAGDGNYGDNYARLLNTAGSGGTGPLRMDYFAGALQATAYSKIAYHESHDEAGNEVNTERTIVTAVNGAPLIGDTRRYAEARSRFAYGMAALSAGTPMFLMGEEIGAAKYFRVGDFYDNKEDLVGQRTGDGRFLFRFYQDLNRLTIQHASLRSRSIDVLYTWNDNRVIAFLRMLPGEQMLVVASLNNLPFAGGYAIQTDPARLPAGGWTEVFNSDSALYGGDNVGNGGATLAAANGQINAVIPANGFVVLQKTS